MLEQWYTLKKREAGAPNWVTLTDLKTTATTASPVQRNLSAKWPSAEFSIELASQR